MGVFEELGLTPAASKDDVKAAYRSLAKKMHPDVNMADPQADEKFKLLTSAYTDALKESIRRGSPEVGQAGRDFASGAGSGTAGWAQGGTSRASWESRSTWRQTGAGPGTGQGGDKSVDPRRYNVEEWERAHYGMHSVRTDRYATGAERSVSDRVRQMQRQAQAMNRQAAAVRSAPPRSSVGWIIGSFAVVAGIWTMVFQTNKCKYNTALGGRAIHAKSGAVAAGRRRG